MRSILCLLLVTSFVTAQREEADVEWQKRRAKISYGVVNVGRHKLDDLAIGSDWRMGRNEASTLETDMAILIGDQVVVPGSYRLKVARPGAEEFALQIDGGSVGESPKGEPAAVYAKAETAKPDKATKALDITFKTNGKATAGLQPAKVTVTFGENRIAAELSLVGTKSQKSGGYTLDAFLLPADVLEKRLAENKPTPLLSIKKETGKKRRPFHVWNLVVDKDGAELWPAPTAPTEQFGFGPVKPLEGSQMVKATSVAWEEAKDAKPSLELTKFEAKGKVLTIVAAVGKQSVTITLPEPKIPED
jgi:hypothetical protein